MAEETTATGTAGAEGAANNAAANTDTNAAGAANNAAATQQPTDDGDKLEKLIQSKVDRITADLGKKNADLQKKLEKLEREKLSDEEVKKLEMEEREKTIADKEKAIVDKENRLFAIKAIRTAGLDDGSDNALTLVDFVLGDNEETINSKVTAFKALVDKMVAVQVDKTFKANGRVPNGANSGNGTQPDGSESNIAVKLGKARAEQAKKSNDVLNYYLGGKK